MVSNMLPKEGQMVVRNSKMECSHALALSIESRLYQMFESRCSGFIAVFMKQEQPLGQFTIVHII